MCVWTRLPRVYAVCNLCADLRASQTARLINFFTFENDSYILNVQGKKQLRGFAHDASPIGSSRSELTRKSCAQMGGLICRQIDTHGRPSRPDLNGPPFFFFPFRGTVLPGFGRWKGRGEEFTKYHRTIKHEQQHVQIGTLQGGQY